jgi:predicted secreted protein
MEKIWKVTETLIKVIDEEQDMERKLRLIGVVKELKSIHQSCMDELIEVTE